METTSEFDGSMAALILAVLVCFPVGIYYYFANKEEMWICPECRESVRKGASTCPTCGEKLDGDVGGAGGVDHDETEEF